MQPRLVQVTTTSEAFAALFEAARSAGVRLGWLELTTTTTPPPELSSATESGALRAVSINDRRVCAVKTLVGEPVLRDVVREHFTGCRLLLVRGEVDAPELSGAPGGWRLRYSGGGEKRFSTEELILALRSPGFP